MRISGFTYIRNGFTYGYPFIPSIKSLLPIVDELIVVVGDSTDGTREAIENLDSKKIVIVDTLWDENLRISGKIFSQQANLGLDNITGDWAINLQADEVFHESSGKKIIEFLKLANEFDSVEGLLFHFYHFWGDYEHIRNTRKTHRYEIRAFKNKGVIRSYKDSQGFRKYESKHLYESGNKGKKLKVLNTGIPIYHYSYARNPKLMKKKSNYFNRFWHNDNWIKDNTNAIDFKFNDVDKLELFTDEHPIFMKEVIKEKDWDFKYDPTKSNMSLIYKILYKIEKLFGKRFFEYRNYDLVNWLPTKDKTIKRSLLKPL